MFLEEKVKGIEIWFRSENQYSLFKLYTLNYIKVASLDPKTNKFA